MVSETGIRTGAEEQLANRLNNVGVLSGWWRRRLWRQQALLEIAPPAGSFSASYSAARSFRAARMKLVDGLLLLGQDFIAGRGLGYRIFIPIVVEQRPSQLYVHDGEVYDKKGYPRAEQLFRDVIRRYQETLPADYEELPELPESHVN